jgi:hypothetical protein
MAISAIIIIRIEASATREIRNWWTGEYALVEGLTDFVESGRGEFNADTQSV